MKSTRLGCLSSTGLFAALFTAFLIAGSALAGGGSMYSPGALNAVPGDVIGEVSSHAEIKGDCNACHTAPWESATMDDRCSACHTNVAADKANPVTVHGKMMEVNQGAKCHDCHPEHHGVTSLLTVLEKWTFPHEVVDFSLNGHQLKVGNDPFLCLDCHGRDVTQFDTVTCLNCHAPTDMTFMVGHTMAFGYSCLNCHDGIDSFGEDFNHDVFTFKLAGKHAAAQCLHCHINSHTIGELQSTKQDCFACHQADDAHDGSLGMDCASCHAPEGWKPSTFDHSRAVFKLDGLHAGVECAKCHLNGDYKNTPQDCYSCHAARDIHNGQLGTDCASCHNASGWANVSFDHVGTSFPLTGKHVGVACKSCHVNGVYKGVPTDCYSCHAARDNHNGQYGKDCAQCHNSSDWKNVSFDHTKSAFQLTGSHTAVACKLCHVNGVYKGTPKDCYSCHAAKDKHNGQFGTACDSCHKPTKWAEVSFDHNTTAFPLTGSHTAAACKACHINGVYKGTPKDCYSCHAAKDKHNGQFGTACVSCHIPTKWSDVTFNHNATAFPLQGRHATTGCTSCHTNGVYKGTPKDCYSCHAGKDKHNGQFGTNCGSCHQPSGWGNVTFNHNQTAFPLSGAHTNLTCSKCHGNGVYAGTPKDCYSCHASRDAHSGSYGTNCGSCHNTNAWKPASFSHKFPLNHGGSGTLSCATCHPNSTSSYTCYACHEHDPANMAEKHKEVNNFSENCAQCHANGKH